MLLRYSVWGPTPHLNKALMRWPAGTLGLRPTTSHSRQLSDWLHLWDAVLGEGPTLCGTVKKCPAIALSDTQRLFPNALYTHSLCLLLWWHRTPSVRQDKVEADKRDHFDVMFWKLFSGDIVQSSLKNLQLYRNVLEMQFRRDIYCPWMMDTTDFGVPPLRAPP